MIYLLAHYLLHILEEVSIFFSDIPIFEGDMMRQVNPSSRRKANWNEDRCLANIRKRISVASRRKAVIKYVAVAFIIALGAGIIKEATYLVAMLCR
ncbi:MAG TPA: hypothetical protein ACFYD6_03650 [Candidatus Brocadiia bacterium]|nr:hypothetical protein [Candidatus Brocadiales bacterium]